MALSLGRKGPPVAGGCDGTACTGARATGVAAARATGVAEARAMGAADARAATDGVADGVAMGTLADVGRIIATGGGTGVWTQKPRRPEDPKPQQAWW